MARNGKFGIRNWATQDGSKRGITYWCMGCQSGHSITTGPEGWGFNGDYDAPVITPSVRVYEPAHKRDGVDVPEKTLCHSFVGSNGAAPGQIVFLSDSAAHPLRGVHDMEAWPEWYGFNGD